MKIATKVFIWIGMIAQCYMIYPVVIGALALAKIDSATSKKELTTLGVLTLLFCNLLGGIFMLTIKDEQLLDIRRNTVIYKKEQEEEDAAASKKSRRTKVETFTLTGIIIAGVLLGISFLTSAILLFTEEHTAIFILFLLLLGLFISISVSVHKSRYKLTKTGLILLSIFAALSAFTIAGSATIADGIGYFAAPHLVSIFLGIILLFSLLIIILNVCKRKKPKKKRKTTVVVQTSRIEIELNEIKRLYDNQIITEEESNRMRTSVIEKYYK